MRLAIALDTALVKGLVEVKTRWKERVKNYPQNMYETWGWKPLNCLPNFSPFSVDALSAKSNIPGAAVDMNGDVALLFVNFKSKLY